MSLLTNQFNFGTLIHSGLYNLLLMTSSKRRFPKEYWNQQCIIVEKSLPLSLKYLQSLCISVIYEGLISFFPSYEAGKRIRSDKNLLIMRSWFPTIFFYLDTYEIIGFFLMNSHYSTASPPVDFVEPNLEFSWKQTQKCSGCPSVQMQCSVWHGLNMISCWIHQIVNWTTDTRLVISVGLWTSTDLQSDSWDRHEGEAALRG